MSGVSQCPPPVTGGRRLVSSPLSRTRYLPPPSPSSGRERRGARLGPLTQPYTPPSRKTVCAAGPWRQRATSRPSGALNTASLWKSPCRVRLRGGMCAGGRMGPGTWPPTLSLSAPELLDCNRCGNGCEGGYIWDAFVTVLNNSEHSISPGGCGVGECSGAESPPGFVYLQVAWPAKKTTHTRGMSEPRSARPRSIKRWPGYRISSCCQTPR